MAGGAMKLPRRRFLHFAFAAAAGALGPWPAEAQAYPAKPVRFIVGFPPGVRTIFWRA
jgi:tripartite-type tricarboxylate transporter receptor subunit TctC